MHDQCQASSWSGFFYHFGHLSLAAFFSMMYAFIKRRLMHGHAPSGMRCGKPGQMLVLSVVDSYCSGIQVSIKVSGYSVLSVVDATWLA